MKQRQLCAVILTALPVEYQAVRRHLIDIHEEIHPELTIYERGAFIAQNQRWEVGIAETRPGGPGAAFEAGRAIEYFKPSVVLFVGVAGGIKDVHIGDVVVADKVYGYESGKADQKFLPRPEVGISTYSLLQRAQREASKDDWLQRLGGQISIAPQPRVLLGAIAAGEKVVTSTKSATAKFLHQEYNDTLAVEMEGYGFFKAVHANQQVEALLIRGISDLIDGKKEADASNSQELASRNASAFAFEILAKLTSADFTEDMQRSSESILPKYSSPSRTVSNRTKTGNIFNTEGSHHTINYHE